MTKKSLKLKSLIIVESPAKAKTINKFVGDEYIVTSSMGHIVDLPKSRLGIEIDNDFKPNYIVLRKKSKILKELKTLAKKSATIYLAPDPDREGEAISWHLKNQLSSDDKPTFRITFNEITKNAVVDSLKTPRDIDMNLVNAQQARRILDRLVGYQISPILWKKVRRGLSAGRVQSVALRLICEREREIQSFVPQEYWFIIAKLQEKNNITFSAKLVEIKNEKPQITNKEDAEKITEDCKKQTFTVGKVEKKERRKHPAPPFITSTLQQESSKKLRFTSKKTMFIAQQLYEGVQLGEKGLTGLVSYIRTDSVRINTDFQVSTREFIKNKYGENYLPDSLPQYKSKKGIQDAHEAIRPSYIDCEPSTIEKYLTKEQFKLYQLIYNRFIASQMREAIFDVTSVDIKAGDNYLFRTTGTVIKFDGFLRIYKEDEEEEKSKEEEENAANILPVLYENDVLNLLEIISEQHFTSPPPRYSEALLIKTLEEKGIGRPSTYSPIISTIIGRNYVERKEGKFYTTELGFIVNDLLVKHFPDILNVEFTALMEDELDKIEEGNKNWVDVIKEFNGPFDKNLVEAKETMRDVKAEMESATDEVCDKCGSQMLIKWGAHGKFLACSAYPKCKTTKSLETNTSETIGIVCDKCGSPMVYKFSRFGRFIACSNYPVCKNIKAETIGIKCPKPECTGDIIIRSTKGRRRFYGCSKYPECNFVSWDKPVEKSCPKCFAKILVEKFPKTKEPYRKCINEGCEYEEPISDDSTLTVAEATKSQ
ncbi:MAG: type I DNA topoisomerase [Candidatus Firestonebacteria bacterium]